MWEWYFLTLKRHLIRSGTQDYWLNSKQPESRVALFSGSETTFLIAISVWKSTTVFQIPFWSMLGYLKVLSLVLCCLFFIWTILPLCVPKDNVYGRINLFADDTSMYATHSDPRTLAVYLQDAADRLSQWFCTWSLTVNIEKTGLLILRRKAMQPISLSITLSGKTIQQVSKHKHLGLLLNSTLTWRDQVDTICSKAAQRIGLLYRLRRRLSKLALRSVYLTAVRPILEYAQLAWSGLSATDNRKLERLQRRAARLITGERLGEQSRGNNEHDLLPFPCRSFYPLFSPESRSLHAGFWLSSLPTTSSLHTFFSNLVPDKARKIKLPSTQHQQPDPPAKTEYQPDTALTHVFSNFSLELPSQ